MKLSTQRQGELLIGTELFFWAIFPIVAILSFNKLSPMVSLAVGSLLSIFVFAAFISKRKLWHEIFNREAYKDILLTTLILGIFYYLFYFFGLQYTTPGNASIIGLTQVFFSFFFFHVLKKEHIPFMHIIGGLLMVAGACIILGSGFKAFHYGDIFILIASMIAPIGNYYAQKARKKVASETILFMRSTISTIVFFMVVLFMQEPISLQAIQDSWFVLIISGIFILGLSKILWIEGIHRISVPKANALCSIEPLITLFFAWLILQQMPTSWQLVSLIPICLGVILLSRQSSNPPAVHEET